MFFVYIAQCSDGSLYTGWTTDVERRIRQHSIGRGSKFVRSRLPVILKYVEELGTKKEALKREAAIKKLSREEKIKLIDSIKSL